MALKKVTVKDLSSEIEKLNKSNNEKDDLIKALDEKVTALQNWAQEMVSAICKRMNENDQLHSTNEKILDQKIGDLDNKLVKAIKKHLIITLLPKNQVYNKYS